MELGHDTLAAFAKSWGLFYLMGLFLAAVVYALWPRNRARFERARNSILEDPEDRPADRPEDRPCR